MVCLFFAANLGAAFGEEEVGPVKRLRKLYEEDKEFRENIILAFKNLQRKSPEEPNPWEGKGIDDLCKFFNEWYYFLPDTTNGLEYIGKLGWFFSGNKYGLRFVREDPGLSWIRDFITERASYMNSRESTRLISKWEQDPAIHMEDFIVPPGGFQSFNEFFTRRIKPGARPIAAPADDSVVAAPADCLINMIDSNLAVDTEIPIKDRLNLNVRELLNQSEFADRFIGGTAASCILLTTTYHRFHAPVSGMVIESEESVHGIYFETENPAAFFHYGNIGYHADFRPFEQFHRGYFVVKTAKYGLVAMIPVGLNTISSVNFREEYRNVTPRSPVPVSKGEELGFFAYGGSLVILLFEKDRFPAFKVLQGQRIGILHD